MMIEKKNTSIPEGEKDWRLCWSKKRNKGEKVEGSY